MFHVHAGACPTSPRVLGVKQVYPGRYAAGAAGASWSRRRRHVLALRAARSCTCCSTLPPRRKPSTCRQLEDRHRRRRHCRTALARRGRSRHRHLRGLRHVRNRARAEPRSTAAGQPRRSRGDPDRAVDACAARPALPIPLVDLRIVDEDMKDVPHDGKASGEIVVRAPWLTQGYLNNPEASASTLGWRLPAHAGHRDHVDPTAISRSPTASRT